MLIEQQEFQEWNMMFRLLSQVTCHFISSNMRRIGLRRENGDWLVEVIIEKENEDDQIMSQEFASELWYSIDPEDETEIIVKSRVIIDNGSQSDFPTFQGLEGPMYIRKE